MADKPFDSVQDAFDAETEAALDALFGPKAAAPEPSASSTADEAEAFDDLDPELAEVLAPLDDIHASAELNARTLAAILAAAEPEPPAHAASASGLFAPSRTACRRPRPARRLRTWLAAALVFFFLTAGTAYALPASYVQVASGEERITLGVNVFGITVSAQASGDEAQAALDAASVRNKGYEESLKQLAEGLAGQGVGTQASDINIEIKDGWLPGDRTEMQNRAERALGDAMLNAGQNAPSQHNPSEGQAAAPQQDQPQGDPISGGNLSSGTETSPNSADQPNGEPEQQAPAPQPPASSGTASAETQPSQPEDAAPDTDAGRKAPRTSASASAADMSVSAGI